MKMTIHVPDDLYGRVKADEGMNASAACQRALADELVHRGRLAELKEKGFERVEARSDERDVAFYGRPLTRFDEGHCDLWVYLTPQDRIVIQDVNGEALFIDDDFDDFALRLREWLWLNDDGVQIEHPLISYVADAISRKYVVELAI